MTNERAKIAHRPGMKGIDAYRTPRAMSADTISFRRSNRSVNTPANGPNRTLGERRASITPATARPPLAAVPPSLATSAATATNPTQSPSEETSIAFHSREKEGWVSRARRPFGCGRGSSGISSTARDISLVRTRDWDGTGRRHRQLALRDLDRFPPDPCLLYTSPSPRD